MSEDSYIKIAIELAKKGLGFVNSGPLVGALVVKKGKIIGAGYNEGVKSFNTELAALKSVNENPAGSVLYSNLETNPDPLTIDEFVSVLLERRISKVVYGTVNPNQLVNGKVINQIKNAGIETKVGFNESECIELNKIYFKFASTKTPFITLKMATTLDGKIADPTGNSKWITGLESRCNVHALRSFHDAVLVGRRTVELDNPELTVRLVEGNNPKRVIFDSNLRSKESANLFSQNSTDTIVCVTTEAFKQKKKQVNKLINNGINVIPVRKNKDGQISLKHAIKKLTTMGISSIMVEGGSCIFSAFIKEKLFDEIILFISPKLLGVGLPVIDDIGISSIQKSQKLKIKNFEKVGEDMMITLTR